MSYFDLFAEEILRIWAKLCKQRGNFLPVQIFPQKVFRSVLIRAESVQESGQKVRKQLLEQKLSAHSLSYRMDIIITNLFNPLNIKVEIFDYFKTEYRRIINSLPNEVNFF